MKRSLVPILLIVVLSVPACDTSTEPGPVASGPNGVFILNEGSFLSGNAEVSFHDPASGTTAGNLYAAANPGLTLGDVANAMVVDGERMYIVVNNSSRIEVMDVSTQRSLGRIALPGLPRQMAIGPDGRGYVTMQDSTVAVLDLQALTVVRSITTGPFPDGVVRAGNRIFVLNSGFGSGRTVSVIDGSADSVIATITTPDGPSYGALGPDGRVYVVCTGSTDYSDPSNDTPGALLVIDPASMQIVDSLTISGHPGKFAMDSEGTMFLLGPGAYPSTPVWKLRTVPSIEVVSSGLIQGNYYGIGLHERRREVFLADAGSFVTNGRVLVYSYTGEAVRTLTTGIGIAPNGFIVVGE